MSRKLKTDPANVRSRQNFVATTLRARLEGRCVNCPAATVPGELRCATHKKVNRRRILAWMKQNRTRQQESTRTLTKRRSFLSQGRCPQCREHRPLAEDRRKCDVCLALQNARHRGDVGRIAQLKGLRVKLRTVDLLLRTEARATTGPGRGRDNEREERP